MEENKVLDLNAVHKTVTTTLSNQWATIVEALPNLLGALVIILIGLLVAFIVRKASQSLLRRVGFDRMSSRAGVSDVMQDAGMAKRPSILAGKIIFWMVLLVFMVPAANMLGLTELVKLFKSFIAFLPKIISALVIIVLGMMLAQFLRKTILEKPATIGSNSAKTLGNVVYGIMAVVVVLVALEQLEIETALLHNIIMLVVGGMMLMLAVAVGLGARGIATNLLSGVYARDQFHQGDGVEIDGMVGVISEVGALSTLITVGEDEQISVPNATLYEQVIKVSPDTE